MLLRTVFASNTTRKQIIQLLLRNYVRSLSIFNQFKSLKQICSWHNLNYFNNTDLQQKNRKFYTNNNLKQNLKLETENLHVYKIMQSMYVYKNKLAPSVLSKYTAKIAQDEQEFNTLLDKDYRKESASTIVNTIKAVCTYAKKCSITLDDTRFDKLVDGLMDKCQDLTDEELADLLQYVNHYLKPLGLTGHNFHYFWSALDDVCCSRIKNWTTQKTLYFTDCWYSLGLSKHSDFTYQAIKKISKKVRNLSPAEIVQSLFYINVCRKRWLDFDFEIRLQEIMYDLTLNELAIVSMAYFKTQTAFKGTMITSHMLDELLKNTTTVHEITLTTILKVIRYSPHLILEDKITKLLDLLVQEINRLSMLCCVHIALLGTNIQLFHYNILSEINSKFSKNISQIRLKDIERLTFVLSLYNFVPITDPDIFNKVSNELLKPERQSEIEKYPRCFASAVHYLGLQQIYCDELINKVMDRNFLSTTYGKNIGREILFLDASLEIDYPEYDGNRLNKEVRRNLSKKFAEQIPEKNKNYRPTAADKLMLDIVDTLETIYGNSSYIHIEYLLPHFPKPDIVLCKDPYDNIVEQKYYFKEFEIGDVMMANTEQDLNWYAIVVGSINMFIRGTQNPVATLETKLRQLTKLGYIPILIPSQIFLHLSKRQREQYLCNKMR